MSVQTVPVSGPGATAARGPVAAPILLGALAGSLLAGRIETGVLCLLVGMAAARAAGARWPGRRWTLSLAAGVGVGWALNLYLTPGRPLAGGWPVLAGHSATHEGLLLGFLLSLRVAGAFAALQGLRAAWPGERGADAVARVLAPLERVRVPVRDLRAMLGLALRFVPLLQAEARRIARVQELRAGRPPRGVRERLGRLRAATVPLLVGALERAERVALALEARHHGLRPSGTAAWRTPEASTRSGRVTAVLGGSLVVVALLWRS